jgi:translation initiation factor 2 subunit 2
MGVPRANAFSYFCFRPSTHFHPLRAIRSRLYFMGCKACGSTRSVAPIKAGFHATARGERKKAREAMG